MLSLGGGGGCAGCACRVNALQSQLSLHLYSRPEEKRSPLAFQSASPRNIDSENTKAEWLECAAFKEIFLRALKEIKYISLHENVLEKNKM